MAAFDDILTPDGIEIRPLDTMAEVTRASDVLSEVWGGDRSGMPPNLLRALAHSGNYAVGLYDGDRMIGASVAFFAAPAARSMHSHITGVLAGYFALCRLRLHEMGSGSPSRPFMASDALESIVWAGDRA